VGFTVILYKNFNEDIIKFLGYGKDIKYDNYSVIKINRLIEITKFRDYIYTNANTLLERKLIKFKEIK